MNPATISKIAKFGQKGILGIKLRVIQWKTRYQKIQRALVVFKFFL
jgi:hypothetical protein